MGLFDFFRKNPSEKRTGPARPKKPLGKGETFTVPEGHHVTTVSPVPFPGAFRTPGGVIVASFGAAGDEPLHEMLEVFAKVDQLLIDGSVTARLVQPRGTLELSELVYGAGQPIATIASPLITVFHVGTPQLLMSDAVRLQTLLSFFHHVASLRNPERLQAAYFVEAPNACTAMLAGFLRVLDVDVRTPHQNVIHAELERPDGAIECMPVGAPYRTSLPESDRYVWKVNAEKAHAARTGNVKRKETLEEEERQYLTDKIEEVGVKKGTTPLLRSPRLTRLLSAVETAEDKLAAMAEIASELMTREAPVLYVQEPNGGVELRTSGPMKSGIYLYPDMSTLRWAAEDLGRAAGSYKIAAAPAPAVFEIAAKDGLGVAVGGYRDRSTPLHAIFPAELVRAVVGMKLVRD